MWESNDPAATGESEGHAIMNTFVMRFYPEEKLVITVMNDSKDPTGAADPILGVSELPFPKRQVSRSPTPHPPRPAPSGRRFWRGPAPCVCL